MKIQLRITKVNQASGGAHIYYVIEQTEVPRSRLGSYFHKEKTYTKTLHENQIFSTEPNLVDSRLKDILKFHVDGMLKNKTPFTDLVGRNYTAVILEKSDGLRKDEESNSPRIQES